MPLTALQIKQASPREKPYKLSDSNGLYLLISSQGQKYWRLDYRHGGKRKTLALGVYPNASLSDARSKRDEAKQQLKNGIDPGEVKRAKKLAQVLDSDNTFRSVAHEWLAKEAPHWAEGHTSRVKRILERDLLPHLGDRQANAITSPELLACLRRVEARGAVETAHRVKQVAGQVMRYAVATGRAERDPSADLKGALATPKTTHMAAVTDPKELGKLLVMLDDYHGTPEVAAALKLAPMLFCRPGELRRMLWSEVNFAKCEWHLPAEKMKMREPLIVPLASQAVDILQGLRQLSGDRGIHVFPSARSAKRPMSDNAVLSALRRLGIPKDQASGHGFRSTARTLLDEALGYRVDLIEAQLAHAVKDANGRAYNRTSYLPQRKEMMQNWANYLDSLKAQASGGNVVAGNFGRTKTS